MRSITFNFPNRWPVKSIALGMVLSLCGCVQTTSPQSNKLACAAFLPITWSSKDDTQTIIEIKAHNAAWKAICGWKTGR